MTALIGPNETQDQAARKGLALLRLMAEAADRKTPDWVNRRVEQLEFLDERAVRWRVSVDFDVPESAPVIDVGGRPFRLIPLTSWEKNNLVAFDLRDESGNTIWLPTSRETDRLLASALIFWAGSLVDDPSPALDKTLAAIVSEGPSQDQKNEERKSKEMEPFEAVTNLMIARNVPDAAEAYLSAPPDELRKDQPFWSQVNELWRNFLIVVAVPDAPGTPRVLKMTFESKIEFRRHDRRSRRALESLGWRSWRLELFIGGRGGSHHLEVAAPPGVDIIGVRARPVSKDRDPVYVTAYGGSPRVHLRIRGDQRSRYLATIRVRVSRPGWLTTSWLAGLVISAVLLVGGLKLRVLFSASDAGTAATLLLALLAAFATMLVSPGAHPLASRLLWASRIVITVDSGIVLLGVGSLLLQGGHHYPPESAWWGLFGLSGLCAATLTVSRFLPKGAPRGGARQGRWPAAKKLTKAWTTAWGWLAENRLTEKKRESPEEAAKLNPAALAIPAADGYHYGDNPDHQWDEESQAALVRVLRHVAEDVGGQP
jgi:hypothetical protein